ncbi:MAG: hypothetical protein WCO10_02350 [bacterium]
MCSHCVGLRRRDILSDGDPMRERHIPARRAKAQNGAVSRDIISSGANPFSPVTKNSGNEADPAGVGEGGLCAPELQGRSFPFFQGKSAPTFANIGAEPGSEAVLVEE